MISRHGRNMLYIFLGDASARLIGFLATTYLARVLGRDGFGIIHIGLAVLSYGLLFSTLGLPLFGTQQIAGGLRNAGKLTGRILLTRIFLSLLIFAIIALFAGNWQFGGSDLIPAIIITYSMFLFPAALLLDWYFQGRGDMGVIAAGRIAQMTVYLLMILLFVHEMADVLTTAWAWVVGGFANTLLLGVVFYRSGYQMEVAFSLPDAVQLIRLAFPLGVSTLISQLVLQFPVLYLGWYATTADVGDFSAAFRLMLILLIIDRIFYTVFFPAITRRARSHRDSLAPLTNSVLRLVTVAALFCALLAVFSADWLVPFVFSSRYVAAIPIFQTLTGYFVCTMMNSVVGYTLVGLGKYHQYTRAFLVAFAVFFLALFLLGPLWGIMGVVAALTLYQFAALLLLMYELHREIRFRWWGAGMRPLGATFLVVLPALWIVNWPLPAKLAAIGSLGLPLLIWLAGIRHSDWKFLKRVLF